MIISQVSYRTNGPLVIIIISFVEGDIRGAKEEEFQKLMARLVAKYSPLHVVDVYEKLGKPEVSRLRHLR